MNLETQAINYWKAEAEKAHAHARYMAKALDRAKTKILKAEPTNRMIEALGVIGEALAKHNNYLLPKNKLS